MARTEKSVFLSYRRADGGWALAVYYALKYRGYDVFFDFTGLGSGAFDATILENVRSRAHFIVMLSPKALKRCQEPTDWFRREAEEAIQSRRNIIPVLINGFDFNATGKAENLPAKMAALRRYHGQELSLRTFEADIEVLERRFLNIDLGTISHPGTGFDVTMPAPLGTNVGRTDGWRRWNLTEASSPRIGLVASFIARLELRKGVQMTQHEGQLYSAAIKIMVGENDDALRVLEPLLSMSLEDGTCHVFRGIAFEQAGNYAAALMSFDQYKALGGADTLGQLDSLRAKAKKQVVDDSGARDA